MKLEDLHKPAIPASYGLLILEVAATHGVARGAMLQGMSLAPGFFDSAEARLSLLQANQLLYRALRLSGTSAIGYEIGLHSSLTSHGFVGYGVLSHASLREAATFGAQFLRLRLPNLALRVFEDGAQAVIEASETLPLGAVRQCMFDLFLVGLWRMAPLLFGVETARRTLIELWFDYPEPPHYAQFRERLPPLRFEMGANQIRFPLALLDRRLGAADPLTARLVTQQCEKELSQLGYAGDFVAQVRALLVDGRGRYPGLEAVAARLHVSGRTLKRRLQQHGFSFQRLQDEQRRRDSIRLLQDPTLSVEDVARRAGYTDPANFTRAFRKWTGRSPSAFRKMGQAS